MAEIRGIFDVPVSGLLATVQAALPDLKASKGAVLVTNGGLGDLNAQVDQAAASANIMGLGLANATKHKLVGLLAAKLKPEGIYVGEVMISGTIKGTPWAANNPKTIEQSRMGEAFLKLYNERTETYARVS